MELIEHLQKRKTLLFILGVVLFIILGAKESGFFGLTEKSGQQILNDIERGVSISKEIQLSEKQKKEIQKLINNAPDNYSSHQKALISDKSGKEILDEIGSGVLDVRDVYLNYKQYKECVELVNANYDSYTDNQTYLVRVKSVEELLMEIGNGMRDPNYMKLNPDELKAMKKLIRENPNHYNELQKIILTREE